MLEVILLYPGFHILVYHRIAHWLYEHGHFFLARWVSQHGRHKTGIEIHPGARIGRCLFIDHGMGIVFGETTVIGDNCTIYHGVTLGGTGKDTGKRHPTLGNNVLIGAGTKVLGPVYIGDNARIGAGSVVLRNLPANCTAVGVPAEVVRINNKAVNPADDLDQQDLPDVMAQRLTELDRRIMQNMEMNGVSLILRSADPNLTPQFISRLFGIDATAVNVIGAGQDGPADHLVNDTADRVDAYAATKGRVESMMSLVSTCIDEKKNISFIVAMQNAAVVIGFVLVAFLTFVAGVEQISAFALVIYELFWVLATVLVPKFRNKVK